MLQEVEEGDGEYKPTDKEQKAVADDHKDESDESEQEEVSLLNLHAIQSVHTAVEQLLAV